VTNLRIRGTDGSFTDGPPSWFKVTAWNGLARHAAMSFRKGHRVIVRGSLTVETWQARDGGTGKTVAVKADALGHDLLWGTSTFVRSAATGQQPAPAPRPAVDAWGQGPEDEASSDEASFDEDADDEGVEAQQPRVLQPAWSTPMGDDETPF
jgi:single-strand DNA-binding protein